MFRVCLNFLHIRFCRTSKASNNTVKNVTQVTVLALLITGCVSTDVYCSKQTKRVLKQFITQWLLRFNWAEETVDAAKICG